MTSLFLNLLLAAPFFVIWVGVPLWLVLKHPDQDHQPQAASGPAQAGRARSRTALDSPAGRALHTTTAS